MGHKNEDPQKQKGGGLTLTIVGLALLVPPFLHSGLDAVARGGIGIGGFICLGLGVTTLARAYFSARQLPKKEILRLAEARKGLLTVSEIATALDLEPGLALKTLQALSKDGIATQRWTEVRKNLWEFPDYLTLPIPESIELAKANGGRLTLEALVASGHSEKTARDTFDALSEKGLAHSDPAPGAPAIIVTTN